MFLKFFVILFFMNIFTSVYAAGSSNPVSKGQSTMSGVSDSKEGPSTKKEKQEVRIRSKSMGGAPNVGTGMGVGAQEARKKENKDQSKPNL